jgi:hypothetical protein
MVDKKNELILINVYAGTCNGDVVFEELPAIFIGNTKYELLVSPGLALNLAKGDIIDIAENHLPAKVLSRGGNFCIQIYDTGQNHIPILEELVSELGGSIDGINNGNLAISVPATAGLDKINTLFDRFTNLTNIQWFVGNKYKNPEDPSDETLSDWWLKV